jgi:hypothetical protein
MADGFGTQPQFDTAEFKNEGNACAFCKTAISAGYYRVQGKLTCANCMQKIQGSIPKDSHAAFVRALIFGGVGALIGLALYAGVEIVTNFRLGLVALAVGYIVAKAMMMGSKNIGGRRYQIVAVLLTYFAISMSAIPVGISAIWSSRNAQNAKQVQSAPATSSSPSSTASSGESQSPEGTERTKSPAPEQVNWGKFILNLFFYGLASPFLEFSEGAGALISLFILFIGLRIAWRLAAGNGQLTVEGPY